jgi:hypothetical protein
VDYPNLWPNDPAVGAEINKPLFQVLAQWRGNVQRNADNGVGRDPGKCRAALRRLTRPAAARMQAIYKEFASPRRSFQRYFS